MRYSPEIHIWAPLDVEDAARVLKVTTARWWLSGGKAIDHWLGRQTRDHGDTDVSVARSDWLMLVEHLPAHLEPHAAVDGELLPLAAWTTNPRLHNIWVRDTTTDRWVLQINIEEGSDRWLYRRDPRVSASWEEAIRTIRSVPTGAPQTQLLWKSHRPMAKDDADLVSALPDLGDAGRDWLVRSIRIAHPDSPWLSEGAHLLVATEPPTMP